MERKYTVDGVEQVVSKISVRDGEVSFVLAEKEYRFKLLHNLDGGAWMLQDCDTHALHRGAVSRASNKPGALMVHTGRLTLELASVSRSRSGQEVSSTVSMNPVAPLTGVIREVSVSVGQELVAHQTVATIEAMKMQLAVVASKAGLVKEICIKVGDQVMEGKVLMIVE